MGQILILKNKGLNTAPNEFSSVPEGAMLQCNNSSIDTDNILEPRRGNLRYSAFASPSDRSRRYAFYQSKKVAAYTGGKVAYDNSGTWSDYSGTYNDPDSALGRIKFLLAQSNLYFTSATGVFRLDAYNGTPVLSGIPKGLDLQLTAVAGSTFATANQWAYRVVWGFRDANNNLFLSSPSGRAVIANSSGSSKDTTVRFTIPSGITTSFFYQVYRSTASGSATTTPDDELGLVYENSPNGTDISNKYVEFTDQTPDSLRGATLYTSPSQQGALQANDRAPLAKDVAFFQNSTFYANCVSKHRKILTILATGGTNGIADGDTLVISGTTYTARIAGSGGEDITTGRYLLAAGGTAAQNIADTAASLIRVINRYATNTLVYATLLSGVNDLPGQMLLEERGLGGSSFAVTASAHSTAFNPALPTSGTTVSSSNDSFQHQLFYSKSNQAEAIPLLNYKFVGSANYPIRRIIPLGNSLFVFKEKEGVYRVTGNSPDTFDVQLFDSSARILAPESADVVNNQIWLLTDQGVTVVSETGVSVVSRPIEDKILGPTGTALDQIKQYSVGLGYETDRKYILWIVSASTDTYATQAFVWNTFTRAFTRWEVSATAAGVDPQDGKLVIGDGASAYTLQERKSLTYTDFVDYSVAKNITAFSGTSVTLDDVVSVEVGDILYQSSSVNSLITAISGNVLTVADTLGGWTVAATTVLKSYTSTIEWTAITGGNPGTAKQWPEIALLFRSARFNSATVSFATDVSGSFEGVSFTGSRIGLWGLFPWGLSAWGAMPTSIPIRVYVPLEKQRSSLLRVKFTIKQGYSSWKLNGLSVPFRDTRSFNIAK